MLKEDATNKLNSDLTTVMPSPATIKKMKTPLRLVEVRLR
jgi:hypothetical protein